MKEKPYHEQVDIQNKKMIKNKLSIMPSYCKNYFISIESVTESRTRLAYVYDLMAFFDYVSSEIMEGKKTIKDITLRELECIHPHHIEEYLSYLRYYEKNGKEYTNGQRGLKRKLAALRSFYAYLYNNEYIENNPAVRVKMPKIYKKPIVKLEQDEIYMILEEIENGSNLSNRQKIFHEKTKERDMAVMMLLLGTGIRVSECVGLDIKDIDMNQMGIRVHRKGGAEAIVYFSKEVRDCLMNYYKIRCKMTANPGSIDAFFLSLRKDRLSVRSIEAMVKKYSETVTTLKIITPHKLRSTFGSALYRGCLDIKLVADTLGNTINVASDYYVSIEEEHRKTAPSYIQLKRNTSSTQKNKKN